MIDNNENTGNARDEIMTLAEIAKYLKVSDKTILRMVGKGEIPGHKISSQWRFQRASIDQWLTAKMQSSADDDLVSVIQTAPKIIPIVKLIPPERIILNIVPGDKTSILKQMVQPLIDGDLLDDPDNFLQLLINREEMGSTGIGDGVAVPHVREQEGCGIHKTCMVLGISRDGIDFDSLDGDPVYLFMLLCADSAVTHLRLLAKSMLMLRSPGMVNSFRRCLDKKEVTDLLAKAHFDLSVRF
jgi:PTS system nitrogen regulatory IIA component